MKFKHLFLVASLALLGFAACEPEEKDLGAPAATLSTQSVTIAQAGGTATVDVSATRAWALSTDADWIGYNPTSGKASEDATEITITVAANTEYDRTGEIYFEVGEGLITKVITVTQPGLKHKETHTGTVDSPYTVEEALEIINAGTYTDAEVYVKGIISSIDTEKDPPGNSYGNATYWISDDGTDAVQLEVYRGYGVGGERMKSADYITVGDEVIVCGVLVMFKSTPEITQGSSIYSLNGRTSGGGGDTEEPKVVTVAEFIAAADSKTQPYQLTGTIGGSINTQYGNFDLSDGTGTIYVYGMTSTNLGYGAKNDQSYASLGLKSGDNITLIGFRDTYSGKNECVYSYFVKKNSSGPDIPDDPGTPSGSGTLADPYDPLGAINAVKDLTWTSNTEYDKTDKVYVKGKISRIANNGTYGQSGTFGNASYWISADGTEKDEFQVYRSLYFNGEKYTEGTDIKVGDEVVVYGSLMNYRGNTPETVANESWLYSLNGKTDGSGGGGDTPGGGNGSGTLADPYDPLGAINAVKDLTWTSNTEYDKTDKVYVKGKISRIANNGTYGQSGTFGNASYWISADGTEKDEFQVYRSLYFNGEKYTEGTDIKVGDEVVVYGSLMNYRGNTPETVANENWLYSLNGKTDGSGSGGGGGETPGGSSVSFATNSDAQSWTAATDGTYGDGFSATTQGVKTAYYKYNSSSEPMAPYADHIRIYKNSAFVVMAPEGKTISKIVITATAADKCVDMPEIGASSTASADTSAKTITWSGTAKNQVVLSAENGQVRAKSIAITFSE